MTDAPRPPRLVVETREVDPVGDLLTHTAARHPLAWVRRGDGMVGTGAAHVLRTDDLDGATIGQRWRELSDAADIRDDVGLSGTGLVAFGALPFDPRSARTGVLIVPSAVVGRRDGRAWITTVRAEDESPVETPQAIPYGTHWAGRVGPGAQTAAGYMDSVRAGLAAISAREVDKVVLARDLTGTIPLDADLRRLPRALSQDYPDTWTFAVDGLIGASPETLVTVRGGTVSARVLAGTAARGADADADVAAAAALATSAKDLDEHEFAVRSVVTALREHTRALAAADAPFTLKLPNVWHLATDVEGELSGAASALDLVRALHPTAAVAGTPTPSAIEVIHRLEPFDRGRYAGPVGWIDAAGDGEWAIALRCAQFDGDTASGIPVTAYAGAGIVPGSDPETELLETRVKFRPIVDALA